MLPVLKKEPVAFPKKPAPVKRAATPKSSVAPKPSPVPEVTLPAKPAKKVTPPKGTVQPSPAAPPKKITPIAAAKQTSSVAPVKQAAPVVPLKKATSPRKRALPATSPVEKPAPVKAASKAPVETPTVAPKRSASRRAPAVPPILLEGDAPTVSRPSGPGQRYDLGAAQGQRAAMEASELPEAYGTERLLLMARDPHWLYAHWDMTAEQLRTHNASSRDGHLVVRVYRDRASEEPVLEQHVHPESRNWFLHVGRGATKYIAQLGFYGRTGGWQIITTSGATVTPPDILSEDTSVRFETIPVEVPFTKLLEVVKEAVSEHLPLVEAIQELREAGHVELPVSLPAPTEPASIDSPMPAPSPAISAPAFSIPAPQWIPREWTPQQERALAQVISIDEVRRVWMGSLEITELIRRKIEHELASQAAAELGGGPGAEQPGGVSSISSPFGGEQRRKGFWFNVNAELIIYGATEADATVTIGGRKIQLRRDGSFSFRFALPDGSYDLPVNATSADGDDSREARLHFRRATQVRGDVQPHPQDAALKTPKVENVR